MPLYIVGFLDSNESKTWALRLQADSYWRREDLAFEISSVRRQHGVEWNALRLLFHFWHRAGLRKILLETLRTLLCKGYVATTIVSDRPSESLFSKTSSVKSKCRSLFGSNTFTMDYTANRKYMQVCRMEKVQSGLPSLQSRRIRNRCTL